MHRAPLGQHGSDDGTETMSLRHAPLLALLATAACSAADRSGETAAMDVAEEAAPAAGAGSAPVAAPGKAIPVSLPRIAYVYEYGFRVPAAKIPVVQRRHADACEKLGPAVCRILDMRQSGAEGDYASGTLALAIAAPRARSFAAQLAKLADAAGAQQTSSAISGEDLSKQIVDTEARLRARTLLRDRLMEVLATRKGTVAELVEAERGVAQVNEEIDQARSWLAEMQGRVDFSRLNLSYASGAPQDGGFVAPIRAALGNIGPILGTTLAALIVLLTVLVPVAALAWAGLRLRAMLRRRRARTVPVRSAEAGETG